MVLAFGGDWVLGFRAFSWISAASLAVCRSFLCAKLCRRLKAHPKP